MLPAVAQLGNESACILLKHKRLILGQESLLEGRCDNSLSILLGKKAMDRGAWWALGSTGGQGS